MPPTDFEIEEAQILPDKIQAFLPYYPNIVGMLAADWEFRDSPCKCATEPKTVEVYLDNNADASITIIDGDVSSCDPETFLSTHKAMAVHCDGQLRYVEIEQTAYFDTLGELMLPDVLIDAVAQAEMFVSLSS
jgi:hypothetical protein